jgi:hypothetical protein
VDVEKFDCGHQLSLWPSPLLLTAMSGCCRVKLQQVIGDEDLHLVEGSLEFSLGHFKSKDNYSLVRMVLGRFRLLLSVSKKVHTSS